jgi:hypothetical protein
MKHFRIGMGGVVACAMIAGAGCSPSKDTNPGGADAAMMDVVVPDFDTGPTPEAAGNDGGGCVPPTGTGTSHALEVTAPETWTAAASPHVIPNDLNLLAQVTLEPCAVVRIAAKATVTVGTNGSLVANGTAGQPVTIDAQDSQKPWASIRFIGGSGHLSYTTIAHGGDPLNTLPYLAGALDVRGTLYVDHVTLTGSASQGIYVNGAGAFDPASSSLVVSGSAGAPIQMSAKSLGGLPSGTYTGNAADQIVVTAEGCTSEAITQGSVTMHDPGVPYVIGNPGTFGTMCVSAVAGVGMAKLTIEPGVTLKFKKGGVLKIEQFQGTMPASGALVAVGTVQKPIVFTSAEAVPAPGDWLGIWFGEVPDASDKIDFATVEYAGGVSTSGSDSCSYTPTSGPNDAAIRVFGPPSSELVTNSTILASAGHGIDRGYRSDAKTPDFLATNTFTNVARCKQTYPRDASGACPAVPPCP